jgi:site-specific DNA-methyltransferase (adenine-specific)
VWRKHNGSGFHADRFKRIHEHVVHWYRGPWADLYIAPVYTQGAVAKQVRRKTRPTHTGGIETAAYRSEDGGPRLQRSVIDVRSCHGHAVHPTQKPLGIIVPLLAYSVPLGGTVLDPFAGSGSTLRAAKDGGWKALGVEADERYCEIAARRLAQGALDFGTAS